MNISENSTNGTYNVTCPAGVLQTTPQAKIVPVVFAIIFIVGVLGNSIIILTVFRNKQMRNVPNILIVSLALGDLLLILVSVPFAGTIFTLVEFPYGNFTCKFNEFLQSLSLGVSVYTLVMLSWDRYTAIARPMSKQKGHPHRRTVLTALLIWVVSSAFAAGDLALYREIVEGECGHSYCIFVSVNEQMMPSWRSKAYIVSRFCIYFMVPVLAIGGFYSALAASLIASSRSIPGEQQQRIGGAAAKQLRARRKVAKVVLSFVLVFIICWLPRHVYLLSWYIGGVEFSSFWIAFKIFSFCLCFINSCANPIALCLLSAQFRRYFKMYLCCCCPFINTDDQSRSIVMYSTVPTNRTTKQSMVIETALD